MKIDNKHVAVKSVRAEVKAYGSLSKWIHEQAEAGNPEVVEVAEYLLGAGKGSDFPRGRKGQNTRAFAEFRVFRNAFRAGNEGESLKVDAEKDRVIIDAVRERAPAAITPKRAASIAEQTASKLEPADSETRLMAIIRLAKDAGVSLQELSEHWNDSEEGEQDKAA